ncbi:MAG: hypothetical protein AAB583_01660 [Patescibacteria group bacterium]
MVRLEREIAGGIKDTNVESERKPSVGVALVIVGIDPSRNGENITSPMFWTVIEKKTNPVTEKVAGQISFPGETWRPPEDIGQNIFGAVVEEFSGDVKQINNLWYVRGRSFMPREVSIGGRPADLITLFFTGSIDSPNAPRATHEVNPNRWMTREDILKVYPTNKVRKFTRETLESGQQRDLIGQTVDFFMQAPLSRVSVLSLLPRNLSIDQFCQEREKRRDVDFLSIPAIKG